MKTVNLKINELQEEILDEMINNNINYLLGVIETPGRKDELAAWRDLREQMKHGIIEQ